MVNSQLRSRQHTCAQESNELNPLKIMESLGGDQLWVDRFFAQHCAVFYYWAIITVFVFSPGLAYVFSELVEVGTLSELRLAIHQQAPSVP